MAKREGCRDAQGDFVPVFPCVTKRQPCREKSGRFVKCAGVSGISGAGRRRRWAPDVYYPPRVRRKLRLDVYHPKRTRARSLGVSRVYQPKQKYFVCANMFDRDFSIVVSATMKTPERRRKYAYCTGPYDYKSQAERVRQWMITA